jgi:hypothetical protein
MVSFPPPQRETAFFFCEKRETDYSVLPQFHNSYHGFSINLNLNYDPGQVLNNYSKKSIYRSSCLAPKYFKVFLEYFSL